MMGGTNNKGFTIVELLIVIVIIAILATLTIVAFNGIQSRAKVSQANSALAQAKKKLELYKVETGLYPTTGNLANAGITDTTTYQYTSNGTTFCMTATSGDVSYKMTETSASSSGGCAGHGQGGVAAVTNLVTNPSFKFSTAGWSGNASTISRITTPWVLDDGAIQITPANQDSFATFDVPAVAGRSYTALATLHVPAAQTGTFQGIGQQRNLFFEFRNSTNGFTGTGNGNTAPSANAAGTYTHRGTGVAPAATTSLRLRLYNGAAVGGGVVYWDHVMIVEGGYNGAYADGSSTDWAWNGTPDGSTSSGPPL